MANFICELEGVRGRTLRLYDTKCVIITQKTAGSLLTGNFTDGEKTLYLIDVVGVQFKKSGGMIGYLQFETPSMQMNNKSDNMFSEGTFTFEHGKNGMTNELMEAVYHYVTDRIEELKYGTSVVQGIPDFESLKDSKSSSDQDQQGETAAAMLSPDMPKADLWNNAQKAQGVTVGKCGVCGTKKTYVLFVEFEDFFGKTEKNVCYECFCEQNCTPIQPK